MSVNANSHWMDRVRSTPTPPMPSKPYLAVPLLSLKREPREIIAARVALRGRTGFTEEQLHLLARDRRRAILEARRPWRGLLTVGLIAAGIAASAAGSLLNQQLLLLTGFGIGFVGLLVGCALLAGLMGPQKGELASYLHEGETLANTQQIASLVRVTRADPELRQLTASWWNGNGPIRRQDLDLVRAFQQARREN
jgi:hypothetical protein